MKKLLKCKEVAELMGISVPTLTRWRNDDIGPNYIRLEGSIRYAHEDIVDYLKEHKISRYLSYKFGRNEKFIAH